MNSRKSRVGRLRLPVVAILFLGLAAGSMLGWHGGLSLHALAESGAQIKRIAGENPASAPVAFIALGALAMALSFPAGALLKVMGGFLFGWLAGAAYVVVATTAGGAILFLLTRSAGGGFLRDRAGAPGRMAREFENGSFTYVLALRLAPVVPFFVASIAPALFNVRLRVFLAATVIGVIPVTLCYAWLGQGLDDAVQVARAQGRSVTVSDMMTPEITTALFALTLVAILAAIVRKAVGTKTS